MSLELAVGLVGFAIVTLFTPGPNNLMLMASGLNYGFERTQPHATGVALGFGFMVLLVGLGIGALFTAFPVLYSVLRFVGAAYLLYLAWRIATAGPIEQSGRSTGRPMTFLQAVAFQWVNPKAWVMAVAAVTVYAALLAFPLNVVAIAGVFATLGFLSAWTWVLFGLGIKRLVTNPRAVRVLNVVMALALVASLYPVFAGHTS